jgi:hypothetical protein
VEPLTVETTIIDLTVTTEDETEEEHLQMRPQFVAIKEGTKMSGLAVPSEGETADEHPAECSSEFNQVDKYLTLSDKEVHISMYHRYQEEAMKIKNKETRKRVRKENAKAFDAWMKDYNQKSNKDC